MKWVYFYLVCVSVWVCNTVGMNYGLRDKVLFKNLLLEIKLFIFWKLKLKNMINKQKQKLAKTQYTVPDNI